MKTKICCRCHLTKEISCFSKDKYAKDGLTYSCKECKKKQDKEYNKNKIVPIEIKNKKIEYQKKWREENYEKISKNRQERYDNNKEIILLQNKIYRDNNLLKTKERLKIYYQNNKEKRKKYLKNKTSNDHLFKLKNAIRGRIRQFLKQRGYTKKNETFDIIGCSPQFLKEHLERQFTNGMTWENRNEWHIDHIVPLSSAKTEDEIYMLCHYTNLQPLWAIDNMKKGSKTPF